MKKFCLMGILVVTTIVTKAQISGNPDHSDSSLKIINVLQLEKQRLEKQDASPFSTTEKASIINYINTLSPRVAEYDFADDYLDVSLESDFHIFDLMEGIKLEGVSLVYYEKGEMHFVNDDIKVETWGVK